MLKPARGSVTIPPHALNEEDPGVALEEHAYRRIRQALMEGLFAPGDRLSIRKVAAALNTSPMPARTALRRLAVEQALDVLPSGTAIVPRLTRDEFRTVGAMRGALEALAVRLAVPYLTRQVLKRLDGVIRTHEAARKRADPAGTLQADREFLFTLYGLAHAPMLLGFIETLWLRRGPIFWEARWALLGHGAARNRHAEMLAALRADDADLAASLLNAEIEAATGFLLSQVQFAGETPKDAGLAGLQPLTRAGRVRGRSKPVEP